MRNTILKALKEANGQALSGNELAEKLGISRVGVWKHIEILREEGYPIQALSRKGYVLTEPENIIDAEAVQVHLEEQDVFKQFHYYPVLESTNQKLREMLQTGEASEGTVVAALRQTGGRGRLGRKWISPPGGLWFSFVLRPGLPIQEVASLSLLFAITVTRALQPYLPEAVVSIKWPNDVFINGKKAAGILLETAGELDQVEYVICGIGLNVNLRPEDFPPELKEQAVSVLQAGGSYGDISSILLSILKISGDYYQRFLEEGFQAFREEYKGLCHHLGQEVKIQAGPRSLTGIHVDVDAGGTLLLRTANGIESVHTGDVQVIDQGRNSGVPETLGNQRI